MLDNGKNQPNQQTIIPNVENEVFQLIEGELELDGILYRYRCKYGPKERDKWALRARLSSLIAGILDRCPAPATVQVIPLIGTPQARYADLGPMYQTPSGGDPGDEVIAIGHVVKWWWGLYQTVNGSSQALVKKGGPYQNSDAAMAACNEWKKKYADAYPKEYYSCASSNSDVGKPVNPNDPHDPYSPWVKPEP